MDKLTPHDYAEGVRQIGRSLSLLPWNKGLQEILMIVVPAAMVLGAYHLFF